MRPICTRRKVGGVLAALLFVLSPHLAAGDADLDPRDRILDLLRTGDAAAALPLLRTYATDHPDDPIMLYNLACAEAGTGDAPAAVRAVRSCLAAGFEDLDRLRTDPDLSSLREDPAWQAILTEEEGRLILLARERGADLAEARRAGPLPLAIRGALPAGGTPALHVRWVPLGLELEMTGSGVWSGLAAPDAAAPWSGGPAVAITLTVPGEASSYASENAWQLVCGRNDKQPVGALYLANLERWQQVAELTPRLDVDPQGRLGFRITVPWRTIMPFHPLVDPVLGLNVACRVPRADSAGYHVAELLPDPARFVFAVPRRRAAVITFDPGSTAAEAFVGRVDDSISHGGLVAIDLTAVVQQAGRGSISLDFIDTAENSVLPGGARGGGLDLVAGVNRIERTADFSDLRLGTYQLRTELVFPAGARANWSTTILHLPPGWNDDLAVRIAELPARDRPTANHLLGLVRGALARHVPRRHPGAIATTLGRLTTLLERGERSGTVLPEAGAFTLVYEGHREARVVEGFLAAAGDPSSAPLPLIVLTDAADFADRLLQRMLRFDTQQQPAPDTYGQAVAYLVPRLPSVAADPVAEAVAALDWARAYFGAPTALLVGVDARADAALAAAAQRPGAVAAVAVFAGGRVGLPGGPDGPHGLDGLRPDLPVTWYDFPMEAAPAGEAVQLRGLLAAERAVVAEHEVRGGLSPSQVGDRVVLWARETAVGD